MSLLSSLVEDWTHEGGKEERDGMLSTVKPGMKVGWERLDTAYHLPSHP